MLLCLVCALGNVATRTPVDSNSQVFVLPLLVDVRFQTFINTSAVTSYHPDGGTVYVYVNRMERLSPVKTEVGSASFAAASFRDITFIVGLYGTDFVFLGPPPRELGVHMSAPICTRVAPTRGIDIPCVVAGHAARISLSAIRHVVADTRVCGAHRADIGTITLPLWIDCADAIVGVENVLSATQMGLGYRVSDTVCFYTSLAEDNRYEAMGAIALLLVVLCVWTIMTHHLAERMRDGIDVWNYIVPYYTVISDVVIVIINVNVFAAARNNHSLYSFTAGRMASLDTLQLTIDTFAYCLSPLVGLSTLFALTAAHVQRTHFHGQDKALSWGTHFLYRQPITYRSLATVIIVCGFYAALVTVWWYGLKDQQGAYVSVVTSTLYIGHRSSPNVLSNALWEHRRAYEPYMDAMLVYVRWGVQFMILTCMSYHMPMDVNGVLNIQFNAMFLLLLGAILLVTTARDSAHILTKLQGHWRVYVVATVIIHAIALFVVWFSALFSVGGCLFSNSEALINKPSLALQCAIAVSSILFAACFNG